MTQEERIDFINKMLDEYKNSEVCLGEMLADVHNLPSNMSIEDAVYIYAMLAQIVDGDIVIRENGNWSEKINEWF